MTKILIETCRPDDIHALDLQRTMQEPGIGTVECYQLVELDEQGYRKSITGSLLWLPDHGRAGIAWGADADWTDANSPRHAVRLWQNDAMVS